MRLYYFGDLNNVAGDKEIMIHFMGRKLRDPWIINANNC